MIIYLEDSKQYADKKKYDAIFLTRDLIIKFFLVLFAMGLNVLPAIDLYWAKVSSYNGLYGNLFIQKLMTRDMFWAINRIIHCNIETVISILNRNFQKYWKPFQFIIVDESIIAFKGRMAARQHIPTKPHSTGIKLYGMADNHAYMWSFWIYRGKNQQSESAKPSDIVLNFIKKIPSNNNHIIIADSYYGSLALAEDIHKLGYKFILSAKKDRPSWLFKKGLHRNLCKGNICNCYNGL